MTESPNIVSERRLGTFTISGTSIWKEPEVVIGILSGCLIVRAEHTYASDQVNYTAFHKDFAMLNKPEPPVWTIAHGTHKYRFYTEYHAEQYARALRLNGTPFTMDAPCNPPSNNPYAK